MAFNWLCACKIRQADISRLRMVAISFSSFGICPMFATSSSRQRTCTGSLPPYTSSALSHKRLKSCVYIMATMKMNMSSVSEIMTKRAVFLSPPPTCQGLIHHFSSLFLGLPCFPCSKSWRMTRFSLSFTFWVLVSEKCTSTK